MVIELGKKKVAIRRIYRTVIVLNSRPELGILRDEFGVVASHKIPQQLSGDVFLLGRPKLI
jgi:hypothetical protein